MEFKENLREELRFQDIKVTELSEKTGISVNTLRNYLNGHNALPNIYSAVKIARALGTTVEALCDEGAAGADAGRRFASAFMRLSERDQKCVLALMKEMAQP